MRAWELTENSIAYYHGSRHKYPIDFILTPQPDGYVMTVGDEDGVENIEHIIEKNRPDSMLPRFDSVFMVDNPDDIDSAGGYIDYIYIVEPLGGVEKNNMGWYSQISGFEDTEEGIRQESFLAQQYWSGDNSPDGGLWEYRSPKARVIRLVEDNT